MANTSIIHVLAVVPSTSDPAKRYEIRRGHDNNVYCTCPAWKFQHAPAGQRTCKHLKSFFASQLANGPEAVRMLTKSESGSLLAKSVKKQRVASERGAAARAAKKAARLAVVS